MTRYHHLLMEFICRTLTGIPPTEKSVLIHLACHADATGTAYPTYEQLAHLSGYSKRTVIDAIKRSKEAGHIIYQRGRRGRANTYRFTCLIDERDCNVAVSAADAPQDELDNGSNEEVFHNYLSSWSAAPAHIEAAFAEFWAKYPRKQDRMYARLAFLIAARSVEIKTMMKGLNKFLESEDAQRDRQFIPLAHNWLTGERWEDEYD